MVVVCEIVVRYVLTVFVLALSMFVRRCGDYVFRLHTSYVFFWAGGGNLLWKVRRFFLWK